MLCEDNTDFPCERFAGVCGVVWCGMVTTIILKVCKNFSQQIFYKHDKKMNLFIEK